MMLVELVIGTITNKSTTSSAENDGTSTTLSYSSVLDDRVPTSKTRRLLNGLKATRGRHEVPKASLFKPQDVGTKSHIALLLQITATRRAHFVVVLLGSFTLQSSSLSSRAVLYDDDDDDVVDVTSFLLLDVVATTSSTSRRSCC